MRTATALVVCINTHKRTTSINCFIHLFFYSWCASTDKLKKTLETESIRIADNNFLIVEKLIFFTAMRKFLCRYTSKENCRFDTNDWRLSLSFYLKVYLNRLPFATFLELAKWVCWCIHKWPICHTRECSFVRIGHHGETFSIETKCDTQYLGKRNNERNKNEPIDNNGNTYRSMAIPSKFFVEWNYLLEF